MTNFEEMTLKAMEQRLNTNSSNLPGTDYPVYAVATIEGKDEIIAKGSRLGMPELEAQVGQLNVNRARFLALPALEVTYVSDADIDKRLVGEYFNDMDERDEMRDEM